MANIHHNIIQYTFNFYFGFFWLKIKNAEIKLLTGKGLRLVFDMGRCGREEANKYLKPLLSKGLEFRRSSKKWVFDRNRNKELWRKIYFGQKHVKTDITEIKSLKTKDLQFGNFIPP